MIGNRNVSIGTCALIETEINSAENLRGDFQNKTICISVDHDRNWNLPSADFHILVILEPRAVMPWQYNQENHQFFDLVLCFNPWRARNLRLRSRALQPYERTSDFISSTKARKHTLVFVNSHKFSACKSSNYALRREIINILSAEKIDFLHFGENWNMNRSIESRKRLHALRDTILAKEKISAREFLGGLWWRYPQYLGVCNDKLEVLGNSLFSLTIENDQDCLSEKLLDSIVAGCIPIYVGVDFSEDFPELEECIFRFRGKAKDLPKFLLNINEKDVEEKQCAIDALQKNSEFWALWRSTENWNLICNDIISVLGEKGNI